VISINMKLAEELKLSIETIRLIEHYHRIREDFITQMGRGGTKEVLRFYDSILEEIEFNLQELWGFEKNKNYHRFWERPYCTCPKMDNDDAYPYGLYVISSSCILHGA